MTIRRSHLTLALAALATAVLYNVWYFVLRPPASAASAGPAAQSSFVQATGTGRSEGSAADPLTIPAPPAVDVASAPSWRRDPFLFGDETRAAARPVAQAVVPVRPTVRTILYSATRRLAIVDGRVVGVGDAVGDYTVAEIEPGAVVFTTPSGERLRVPVHETESGPIAR